MRSMVLVGLLAAVGATARADQNPLEAAKDLYASAAYEEALSTLSRVGEGGASAPAVARQVDEYRAFCLYALGRTKEAESVAESLIRREPLAPLAAADASPRLEAMFAGVQKRILPSLIREEYRNLRPILDRKDYAAAEPRLAEARRMLNEAERLGAWDEGLADLSVIVEGFLALSRARVEMNAPAPAPPAAPAASAAPAAPSPPSPTGPSESAPMPSTKAGAPRAYRVDDANVTPPVPIYQRPPSLPRELMTILKSLNKPTIMSLTIDETGGVEKAEVRVSTHSSYDTLLIRAAAFWKYKPATRDGVPVRYEKVVVFDVK
jgi:tetratricopeptide (TPR) repeat protein